MSSHSLPFPLRQTRGKIQLGVGTRLPSLRTVLFIVVAVLILFRWLNLILALEITRTGREIQTGTEQLRRQERHNARLRLDIAQAQAPTGLAEEATKLGYQPRKPEYLPLDEPLAHRSSEARLGMPVFGPSASGKSAEGLAQSVAGSW